MSKKTQPNPPRWLTQLHGVQYFLVMKPGTFKDLCELYETKYRAMKTLVKPLDEAIRTPFGRYFSVRQLEAIIDHIGPPYIIYEK